MSRRTLRRGISLLEVLFSIFVLSIGLLGLAALVPFGRLQIVEANHADRGKSCGNAGLSEIKTRQLLDPRIWSNSDGTAVLDNSTAVSRFNFIAPGGAATYYGPAPNSPVPPFAIDPLFVAGNYASYPANARAFALDSTTAGRPFDLNIPRITLGPGATAAATLQRTQLPDRVFLWQDDLIFGKQSPEPPDQRLSLVNAGQSTLAQSAGNYSWLITVSPAGSEASLGSDTRRLYTVSVVVFYKRKDIRGIDPAVTTPSERLCIGSFPATPAVGGGDITLNLSTSPANAEEYFDLKTNQWVMIVGQQGAGPSYAAGTQQQIIRWYRVVGAYPLTSTTSRDITLAGPDWSLSNPCFVAIYDGIVGVFEKTMELDPNSLWFP